MKVKRNRESRSCVKLSHKNKGWLKERGESRTKLILAGHKWRDVDVSNKIEAGRLGVAVREETRDCERL